MDGKAELESVFLALGIPTAFLVTSAYYENFLTFFVPRRDEEGTLRLTHAMGDAPMAIITIEDIGRAAGAMFKQPDAYIGKHVTVTGENLTLDEIVAIFSEVTGKTVVNSPVPPAVYATFPFRGADELANMFQFFRDGAPLGYTALHSVEVWKELGIEPKGFKTWLLEHRARLEGL
jgi:uncharacterized protein YbjT (DUF2867 family)